jgi:plastocyanin
VNWKIALIIGALVVAAGIVFLLLRQGESSAPEVTLPPAQETIAVGKDVNIEVQITRRAMRPSEITVERGDRVYVYATALDQGITVYRADANEEVALTRDVVHTFAFAEPNGGRLTCLTGCEEGVMFTVKTS